MEVIPFKRNSTALSPLTERSIATALNRPLPKYFTQDEVKEILSEELRANNYKQYFMCLFLWNTGTRVGESLSVKVDDVDMMGKVLRVSTLKRDNHERVIPLQSPFLGEIAIWINQNGLKRNDKLFNFKRRTAYNYVRFACELAGINDSRSHPHTFRHSFAVNCILHGVPLPILREWLGHRDITKTLIYTQILAHDSRIFIEQVFF